MKKKKPIDIKRLLTIVTIISIISTVILGWWGVLQKTKADRLANEFELSVQIQREYTDKNGVLVKEVENLNLSKMQLRQSGDTTVRKLLIELASNREKVKMLSKLLETKKSNDLMMLVGSTQEMAPVIDSLSRVDTIQSDTIK